MTEGSEPGPEDERPLRGLRIVLVDDDRDTLDFVDMALTIAGASVVSVDSAPAAVAALGSSPADVMVSDLSMPAYDGFWLIQHVRSSEAAVRAGRRLPVLAVTAHSFLGGRGEILSAGFDEYLLKPIDARHLIGVVRRLTAA